MVCDLQRNMTKNEHEFYQLISYKCPIKISSDINIVTSIEMSVTFSENQRPPSTDPVVTLQSAFNEFKCELIHLSLNLEKMQHPFGIHGCRLPVDGRPSLMFTYSQCHVLLFSPNKSSNARKQLKTKHYKPRHSVTLH